jgi:hypothetical protein
VLLNGFNLCAATPRLWRAATRHSEFGAAGGGVGGNGTNGGVGGNGGHVVIGWFWRAVESLEGEARAALLCFWTGASTLGPSGFEVGL